MNPTRNTRHRLPCLIVRIGSLLSAAVPLTANSDPALKVEYRIVNPDRNPFPREPRTDLSVNVGGGKGVVIAPHWVLTASHCISSKRNGVVPVTYVNQEGTKVTIKSDQVIREGSVDLALVRLTKPAAGRTPLLLLKDGFPATGKGKPPFLLKKVAGNGVWDRIPARISAKSKGERFYVGKDDRHGKAGTSGSPWVIHSPLVGDVLVGVTHGTGRVPQVGKVCEWIERTVSGMSDDRILWATPEQALADRRPASASPDSCNVIWDSPGRDHHGSMPLGNGSTALNAWIDPKGDLEFYIGRTDSWGEYSRLLKVGKLRVTMNPAPPLDHFRQILSLSDATMKVRYGDGADAVDLSLWVDANHPVIHVAIDSRIPRTATAGIELWRTKPETLPSLEVSDVLMDRSRPDSMHGPTVIAPDTVLTNQNGRIGWYHRNLQSVGPREHAETQDTTGFKRPDPLIHRTFGAVVMADGGKRLDDLHLESPLSGRHRFSIFVDTLQPATEAEWLSRIEGHVQTSSKTGFEKRRADHEAWWSERWNRSWIIASESSMVAAATRIPPDKHAFVIGSDQTGGTRLAAEFGRLSVLPIALEASAIAELAARPPDQPLAKPDRALHTAAPANAGPVANSKDWRFDGGLTIEAWIKPGQAGSGGGRIVDRITAGRQDGFLLDTHQGLRLIVGKNTLQCADQPAAGAWSHVAAVIPPQGQPLRLFLNGKLVAEEGADVLSDARAVTRAYTLQRFITLCAGRGEFPIKFNGSLFTVPAAGAPGDADYRRWGPGYWWQNTRLPYISLCASGDTDLMNPLFAQYIDRFLPLNLYRTRRYFGHGGAYWPECVHFWGEVFNESYGWKPASEREDKLQQSGYHKWEWVAGPEIVHMALDYHDHTGDAAFLRDKVFPAADAVLRFFDEHYQTNAAGKLVMHPSQALETWWDTTDPMPEVAGLIGVTRRLLALPVGLTTAAQRDYWKTFLGKLPPLPVREVDGKPAFAPAGRFASKKNVENPELYCVFPFRLSSFNRPNAELAVRALDHRWDKGNSGWRQDDIFMAYLGLTDQARNAVVARARNHDEGSRFPAFWGPNYDWTPDQDHGGVLMKAFQSMLMQAETRSGDDQDGKIHLLPAWPREWNVDFKLHAPENTTVEGRYRDGRIESLVVSPSVRRKDIVLPHDVEIKR